MKDIPFSQEHGDKRRGTYAQAVRYVVSAQRLQMRTIYGEAVLQGRHTDGFGVDLFEGLTREQMQVDKYQIRKLPKLGQEPWVIQVVR